MPDQTDDRQQAGDHEPTASRQLEDLEAAVTRSRSDTAALRAADRPLPGTIGSYRILGLLGQGGMGVVYEAEQQQPRRRVALKVMQAGTAVDDLRVRMFEREVATLARLDHPNIAAIYESGRTDRDEPYFAMELVQGETLDVWLRSRPTPITSDELALRLGVFRTIAEAVHAAHQRGVIHRDLKPANLIVVRAEETGTSGSSITSRPLVKILDFGLARITDSDLQAATLLTEVGMIKGTLPYMAPEQARGDAGAIDVRTDVYALGVILYEMLAGTRPYDLGQAALLEAVRVICEQDPTPMSSTWRGTRRLDADVETIVLHALEKEPARRYGSAAAMAEDVERYLQSQPIAARPPTVGYRAAKFVRRHRLGVATAATAAAALIAVAVTMTYQAAVVARERDRAEQEAAKATAINVFLRNMLTSADPWTGGERELTVVEALARAEKTVDASFGDQPLVEADVRAAIAGSYLGLGHWPEAERLARQALALRISELGSDHPDVAEIWGMLERILRMEQNFPEAEAAARERLRILEQAGHVPPQEVVEALQGLAWVQAITNQLDAAEATAERALEAGAAIPARALSNRAGAIAILQRVAAARGDTDRAEALILEEIELRRKLDPSGPELGRALADAGMLYMSQGRYDEAEAITRQALAIDATALGEDDPRYAEKLENLANISFRRKNYDQALELLGRVREIRARNLGDGHLLVARTLANMAVVATESGQATRALELYDQALPRFVAGFPPDHPDLGQIRLSRALTLEKLGRLAAAESDAREAVRIFVAAFGEEHGQVAAARSELGVILVARGRLREAEPLLVASLPGLRSRYGDAGARVRKTAAALVELYERSGRPDAAAPYRELAAAPSPPS